MYSFDRETRKTVKQETSSTAPANKGRERTCAQCGTVYRSPRQSRYCGNACRTKAKRGAAPKTAERPLSVISKALRKLGMIGPIGPADVLGLTVPRVHALEELSYIFQRRGWGYISPTEFDEALRTDGIRSYSADSPETTDRKRLQARQRVATARLLKIPKGQK